jgi:hypothetical protein
MTSRLRPHRAECLVVGFERMHVDASRCHNGYLQRSQTLSYILRGSAGYVQSGNRHSVVWAEGTAVLDVPVNVHQHAALF